MSVKGYILIFHVIFVVTCEKSAERKARLFTFNAQDEDIRIDLDFSVPFISIPVKKTLDATFGYPLGFPTININPASIALAGIVVLATTVFMPYLLKGYAHDNPHLRYSKLLDAAEFKSEDMLDFASKMLSESRSVRGCALRIACWTGQKPGNADFGKIWNQVLSNKLLSSMVNSTAVEDALTSGRLGRDCGAYSPCPLRERHLPALLSNMAALADGLLFK